MRARQTRTRGRIETNLVIRDGDGDRGGLLASAHVGPDGVDHIFGLQPDEKKWKEKGNQEKKVHR
jgi:hypothetical protein